MTREEAIVELRIGPGIEEDVTEDYSEAADMAIKALEQEPCEDTINRQAVLDLLERNHKTLFYTNKGYGFIKRSIEELPSVSPARLRGKWEEVYAESDGSNSWIEFQCPHCGDTFGIESGEYGWHYTDPIPWKACPMCGGLADMRGDNNENR